MSISSYKIWLSVFVIVVIFASLSIVFFETKYQNHFYPNIFIANQDVSGKTYAEVFEKFKAAAGKFSSDGFEILINGESQQYKINVPVSVNGLTPDTVVEYFSLGNWEKTLRDAYQFGREKSLLKSIYEQALLVSKIKIFPFSGAVKREAVNSLLSREAESLLKKPESARFALTDDSQIFIFAEKSGEQINTERIVERMNHALAIMDSSPITIATGKEPPSLTAEKLKPFLDKAKQLASVLAIRFKYNGYKKYLAKNELATWLTLSETENALVINRSKLEEFIARYFAPLVENPVQNSRFSIQDGKLVEISPGQEGNAVDIDIIQKNLQEKLSITATTTVTLPIQIISQPPRVTKETIAQYDIKDLVAASVTSFKGSSENRKHNIQIGVEKLNGLLIAPGEEFSAVATIGTTTEKEGFVKEFVIKEDRSVKELGGGLCQIATTLFRLALNAGLPITERVNHRYVVSYYGPGLDATIYGPEPDLRFVNDTGHYLLLQTRMTDTEVMFEFYGQKDGRTVSISDPKLSDQIPAPPTKYLLSSDLPTGAQQCAETPHDGVTAEVSYTVQYPEGKTREQVFKSVYQPWQRICLLGIAQ